MILEKLQKLDNQFKKIDDTIQQAVDAKAKIDLQIKTLEEQLLVLKGQYQAYVDIGRELNEITVDENGDIVPVEHLTMHDSCQEENLELNSPMMGDF